MSLGVEHVSAGYMTHWAGEGTVGMLCVLHEVDSKLLCAVHVDLAVLAQVQATMLLPNVALPGCRGGESIPTLTADVGQVAHVAILFAGLQVARVLCDGCVMVPGCLFPQHGRHMENSGAFFTCTLWRVGLVALVGTSPDDVACKPSATACTCWVRLLLGASGVTPECTMAACNCKVLAYVKTTAQPGTEHTCAAAPCTCCTCCSTSWCVLKPLQHRAW